MISVRSHVVALLAVVLALAVGIALGSGPLQSEIATRTASAPDGDAPEDADDRCRGAARRHGLLRRLRARGQQPSGA